MKVKDSVYDKHGHELFFKDLETLLRHKEPVYNKDAHWGLPQRQPEEHRAFEEERRLFYVGMTRAKKRLFVFTTGAKSVFADELFGREKVRKR